MHRCETSVRPAPSALWLRSTDLFSPQRSNACSGCESVKRASKLLTLRLWGLMCASYPRGGHGMIPRPRCLEWPDTGQNLCFIRQRNLPPFCILIYLLNVIMGLSDVLGDACHLHLFPVFTSAIDSCAPIFIKPLFHSFPPVICLSLSPHTHTTPSSLLSLSSTSPQMSLSTHLLSPRLHTGAKTQPSVFCLRR